MQVAATILKEFPNHYQGYHTLGVLWYHHPDKTRERSTRVKEILGRALEVNPDSQFSIQYLAYIHFDERDYRTALTYYQKTDRAFFEGHDQHWRWLKAWESMIACRIHLSPESRPFDEILKFISAYNEAAARDEGPAVQWELWRALRSLTQPYRTHYAAIIDEVRDFLIKSGNEFVLKKEPDQCSNSPGVSDQV